MLPWFFWFYISTSLFLLGGGLLKSFIYPVNEYQKIKGTHSGAKERFKSFKRNVLITENYKIILTLRIKGFKDSKQNAKYYRILKKKSLRPHWQIFWKFLCNVVKEGPKAIKRRKKIITKMCILRMKCISKSF